MPESHVTSRSIIFVPTPVRGSGRGGPETRSALRPPPRESPETAGHCKTTQYAPLSLRLYGGLPGVLTVNRLFFNVTGGVGNAEKGKG